MSIDTNHYVGYYFMCENKDVDVEALFPDESMSRVFDEGGNKEINNNHLYIPNRTCTGCYYLDKHSETGIRGFDGEDEQMPELITTAEKILKETYLNVELRYGVVTYAS